MAPIIPMTERQIARTAEAAAVLFRARDLHWVDDAVRGGPYLPGPADIALRLRGMVADLSGPGARVECGHLVAEWPGEDEQDDLGPDIRVFFHLADLAMGPV